MGLGGNMKRLLLGLMLCATPVHATPESVLSIELVTRGTGRWNVTDTSINVTMLADDAREVIVKTWTTDENAAVTVFEGTMYPNVEKVIPLEFAPGAARRASAGVTGLTGGTKMRKVTSINVVEPAAPPTVAGALQYTGAP